MAVRLNNGEWLFYFFQKKPFGKFRFCCSCKNGTVFRWETVDTWEDSLTFVYGAIGLVTKTCYLSIPWQLNIILVHLWCNHAAKIAVFLKRSLVTVDYAILDGNQQSNNSKFLMGRILIFLDAFWLCLTNVLVNRLTIKPCFVVVLG